MTKQKTTDRTESSSNRNQLAIGLVAILIFLGAFVGIVQLFNGKPKIVYQPSVACEMFTFDEAKAAMGDRSVRSNNTEPTIQKNAAISRCGYTDGNTNMDEARVAAIIVRSAINDTGKVDNRTDFETSRKNSIVEEVVGIGDDAFFNTDLGQLNVRKGNDWIIMSYGVGANPAGNDKTEVVELAKKIL